MFQVSRKGVLCHEKSVRHLVVTPSGNHLVTGGDDGEVKVWVVTSSTLDTHDTTTTRLPHLAHRRTVHTGRGPITNLALKQITREVSLDIFHCSVFKYFYFHYMKYMQEIMNAFYGVKIILSSERSNFS